MGKLEELGGKIDKAINRACDKVTETVGEVAEVTARATNQVRTNTHETTLRLALERVAREYGITVYEVKRRLKIVSAREKTT